MTRAVIASGTGRYADPWHPFDQTSAALAAILSDDGIEAHVSEVEDALSSLEDYDLLVVNAGDPWRLADKQADTGERDDGLTAAFDRGIGVLAVHYSAASLRDYPEWVSALGAVWLPGVSWHPPASTFPVRGLSLPHGETVSDFEVADERYTKLQRTGWSTVVAQHDVDNSPSPTAWVRRHRQSRVAVDLLGHDERSFTVPGHQHLVRQLAKWVTRQSG